MTTQKNKLQVTNMTDRNQTILAGLIAVTKDITGYLTLTDKGNARQPIRVVAATLLNGEKRLYFCATDILKYLGLPQCKLTRHVKHSETYSKHLDYTHTLPMSKAKPRFRRGLMMLNGAGVASLLKDENVMSSEVDDTAKRLIDLCTGVEGLASIYMALWLEGNKEELYDESEEYLGHFLNPVVIGDDDLGFATEQLLTGSAQDPVAEDLDECNDPESACGMSYDAIIEDIAKSDIASDCLLDIIVAVTAKMRIQAPLTKSDEIKQYANGLQDKVRTLEGALSDAKMEIVERDQELEAIKAEAKRNEESARLVNQFLCNDIEMINSTRMASALEIKGGVNEFYQLMQDTGVLKKLKTGGQHYYELTNKYKPTHLGKSCEKKIERRTVPASESVPVFMWYPTSIPKLHWVLTQAEYYNTEEK